MILVYVSYLILDYIYCRCTYTSHFFSLHVSIECALPFYCRKIDSFKSQVDAQIHQKVNVYVNSLENESVLKSIF